MTEKPITDRELDILLKDSREEVEDRGFSRSVMKRIRSHSLILSLIPVLSGSLGALIVLAVFPQDGFSSLINRLTDPLFSVSGTHSSELLMFLASYGIKPSLLWILVTIPISILPFALHQE